MERTQTLMRQKFGTLGAALALTLVLLPAVTVPASAAGTTEDIQSAITTYNSNHGGTGSLTAASDGSTVTVTGSVTDATAGLTLGIDSGVTVVWKATLSSASTLETGNMLIELSGDGAFEVAEGSNVNATVDGSNAINAPDTDTVTVTVSGGSVKSAGMSSAAIYTRGNVTVSGGSVSTTGRGNSYAIRADGTVTVSGTGSVSSTTGTAIGADSTVTVSDNGRVSSTVGTAIYAGGDVTVKGGIVSITAGDDSACAIHADRENSTVKVEGGRVSAVKGFAIQTEDKVTVTVSGGIVEVIGDGEAIRANSANSVVKVEGGRVSATTGNAIHSNGGAVTVSGTGSVSATTGYVIFDFVPSAQVTVSGGVVFAYGSAITGENNVIYTPNNTSGFTIPTDTGVVIAWNQAAGTTTYNMDYTTDLNKLPTDATATAKWAVSSGVSGIFYNNGASSGFLPVPGVTVVKQTVAAPTNAPTKASETAYSVTLTPLADAGGKPVEYAVNTTAAAPNTGWQSGPIFENLTPNTEYFFYARFAEGSNYSASPASPALPVTTYKAAQETPLMLTVSSGTAVLGLTAPTLTPSGGNGTGAFGNYTSSNTSVATVDATTGEITLIAVGTTAFAVKKAGDNTFDDSFPSNFVPLNVVDKIDLSARALTTSDATLKNEGKYTVGSVARAGAANDFTLAITGTAALEAYASSSPGQGTHKWAGLLIGDFKRGGGVPADITTLYYKTSEVGSYTQLTTTDAEEAASVGGAGKDLVLWIKTEVTATRTIWLATSASGDNSAKLTITFTPYAKPASPIEDGGSGGSGGGGSSAPTAPTPSTSGSTVTTTVTPTVKNGAATASVPASQVSAALAAAKKAAASGEAPKVEISLGTTAGATSAAATLPQESVKALASGGVGGLTVSSGVADLTFDAAALSTISGAASGSVTVTASKVDTATLPAAAQALVGNRPVFEFSVTSGGKTVSQFGGSVAVSVPYTLGAGEDPNAVIVSYLNTDGNLETVMNCRYNAATGTVTFTTTHFSQYAVGYNKVAFTDVADGSWCADAVTFLAARGITGGTGDGSTFSPSAPLTRGQFITFLLRAYGVEPLDGGDNFSDAGDTYYTGYLAAAKRLGITSGVGGNQFAPDRAISRQQMLTLAYNALKVLEKLPEGASGKTLSDFTDSASVAGYAQEAMTALVKSGTVAGSGGKLNPQAITSRGQMAQVLYNLLGK